MATDENTDAEVNLAAPMNENYHPASGATPIVAYVYQSHPPPYEISLLDPTDGGLFLRNYCPFSTSYNIMRCLFQKSMHAFLCFFALWKPQTYLYNNSSIFFSKPTAQLAYTTIPLAEHEEQQTVSLLQAAV